MSARKGLSLCLLRMRQLVSRYAILVFSLTAEPRATDKAATGGGSVGGEPDHRVLEYVLVDPAARGEGIEGRDIGHLAVGSPSDGGSASWSGQPWPASKSTKGTAPARSAGGPSPLGALGTPTSRPAAAWRHYNRWASPPPGSHCARGSRGTASRRSASFSRWPRRSKR